MIIVLGYCLQENTDSERRRVCVQDLFLSFAYLISLKGYILYSGLRTSKAPLAQHIIHKWMIGSRKIVIKDCIYWESPIEVQ